MKTMKMAFAIAGIILSSAVVEAKCSNQSNAGMFAKTAVNVKVAKSDVVRSGKSSKASDGAIRRK